MIKYVTCKKCYNPNCVWVFSKKGKWYLAEPDTISTKSAYKNISIPFAHKCNVMWPKKNEDGTSTWPTQNEDGTWSYNESKEAK